MGRVGPDGALTPSMSRALPASSRRRRTARCGPPTGPLPALPRRRTTACERRPAPFTTRQLRFTPDGGLWLAGHTRLEHLDAAEVAAATAPASCDLTGPRVTLPGPAQTGLRVRTLRRRGLRLRRTRTGPAGRSSKRSGGGTPRIVDRVLRRGQDVKRLPAAWLRRPGASLMIGGTITDADGNIGDLPITIKLGP